MNEKNLQDVEAVGDAIRRAVKRSGTRTKTCAVAVPSAMVITKVIQMPNDLKPHEMDAQIQLEADQYIPYALEEVNLDFQVIGPSEEADGMVDVLLAASTFLGCDLGDPPSTIAVADRHCAVLVDGRA